MRATLILFTLLVFSMGAVAVPTGTAAEHATRFTVSDTAAVPFSQPVLRLLPLPQGATSASARVAADPRRAHGAAGIEVTARPPMVIRGLPVLPVVVAARGGSDPAQGPRPSTVDIELTSDGPARRAPDTGAPALRHSRGFFEALAPILPAGALEQLATDEEGEYLIIAHRDFLGAAESLADWKREQGFQVFVTTTDQTGASKEQIRTYISNRYHSSPVPPEYVVLVGDVAFIPSFGFHGAVTDHQYALMDEEDFLPDLLVGRLSVQNTDQANTAVAKIIRFESDPYRGDGGQWMGRGLTVAKNFPANSNTQVPTSRWCAQEMLNAGFTQVDHVYFPDDDFPEHPDTIRARINDGVSLVTYRGWAQGADGWEGHFYSWDVRSLGNGWMDPVVFSWVCHNNDYSEDECYGEAWLRVGSLETPFGGVGFIGNSEPWSHTRFNDGAAIGAFDGIGRHGLRQLGEVLLAAKMSLLAQFPNEVLWTDVPDGGESVEYYFYIYTLLGDPSMELWCGVPRALTVRHDEALAPAANFIDVAVADSADATPVAGARVGVSRGDALLGCAWTDTQGHARIPVSLGAGADPVKVTVTGRNAWPYRGEASVGGDVPFLSPKEVTVIDDGTGQSAGNGDGRPSPSESLELHVTLHNNGSETAQAGKARILSLDQDEVVVGEAPTAEMAAGVDQALGDPLVVRIAPERSDGFVSRFELQAIAGTDTSRSLLTFSIEAPALNAENPVLSEGGVLLPGEAFDLQLSLRNAGAVPALGLSTVLRSRSDLAVVIDSTADFDRIDPGSAVSNTLPYRIEVLPTSPIGQAAAFTLEWSTSSGAIGETSFSLPIGVAAVNSPLGPDQYGYWAYDNADTDYPVSAPLYSWIECSPVYGGSGTKVRVVTDQTVEVVFPDNFSFRYYGVDYDRIQVSDNGWISFRPQTGYNDFYNWSIPSSYGNGTRVAAFWDNLNVYKADLGNRLVGDAVYALADSANHRFVVEWSRIGNTDPLSEGEGLFYTDLQTFEIVLLDPAWYPTPTGDGIILFQYKQVLNIDQRRMYSSVGIENAAADDGLQYTYSNNYPPEAGPLSDGLAIKFTTEKPVYSPFRLASFEALPGESGVLLSWSPIDERPRGGYRIYRSAAGARRGPVEVGRLGPEARSYLDAGASPDSAYTYRIGSTDPVGRETLLGPFEYAGGGGPVWNLLLSATTANPFRGACTLTYTVPRSGTAGLRVYDVAGRCVRTLVEGGTAAGPHAIAWDGKDANGRDLPGGVYFARLQTGAERRELKLTLLR